MEDKEDSLMSLRRWLEFLCDTHTEAVEVKDTEGLEVKHMEGLEIEDTKAVEIKDTQGLESNVI